MSTTAREQLRKVYQRKEQLRKLYQAEPNYDYGAWMSSASASKINITAELSNRAWLDMQLAATARRAWV